MKKKVKWSFPGCLCFENVRKNFKLNLVPVFFVVLKSKALCCKVKLAGCRAYHLLSWSCLSYQRNYFKSIQSLVFILKECRSWIWKPNAPCCSVDVPFSGKIVALENSRHFVTPPMVFPRNDDWVTTEEIPYWWRVTTQIWVVRLIGWNKFLLQRD